MPFLHIEVMSRLLTYNCHEGYVHLLGKLGFEMDVIDGLPNRATPNWDTRMRPVPDKARLIRRDEIQADSRYDVAICHNITDLVELKSVDIPKILVLHVSLHARIKEEKNAPPPSRLRAQLGSYLDMIGASAVAVSEMKRRSWGLDCDVIRPTADASEYGGYTGHTSSVLRVANSVIARPDRFAWPVHVAAVGELPCWLMGYNPEVPGARTSRDWEEVKQTYRDYRVLLHTAGPLLDDGYNMAVVEAMASGMPVVSTESDGSPIEDGVNGYCSDDPAVLHARLKQLLSNQSLARELGARARETALDEFSVSRFVDGWHRAIEAARRNWQAHRAPCSA